MEYLNIQKMVIHWGLYFGGQGDFLPLAAAATSSSNSSKGNGGFTESDNRLDHCTETTAAVDGQSRSECVRDCKEAKRPPRPFPAAARANVGVVGL